MAHLVRIGNSKGVRIPKTVIEEAHLEGKELDFRVVKGGLMISPSRKPRKGWAEAIQVSQKDQGVEGIDSEWLDVPLASDDDWEW